MIILKKEETQKIFEVIEQALLSLCREKPNDPVDYLSRKMLELIGDDPNSAIRKKTTLIEGEVKDNIVLSAEKIAIQNLKKDFYQNYKIIEDISLNNYLIEDLKLGDENGQKCVRIIDKSTNKNKILMSDRIINTLVKLSHPNLIRIIEILEQRCKEEKSKLKEMKKIYANLKKEFKEKYNFHFSSMDIENI